MNQTHVTHTDDALWAALDLGSNSFHMLLVRRTNNGFVVQERLKEKVQLLAGFADQRVQPDAQQRGLDCLARFAQRLKPISRAHISVMGTHALRQAENAADFSAAAQDILQTPVNIISGEYEARLIYRGVSHHLGVDAGRRLIIDIGGGSTELAVGEDVAGEAATSVNMGCVAFRDEYFANAITQAHGYAQAKQAAVNVLQSHLKGSEVLATLQKWPQYMVGGTSGTVESIQMVLRANGWSSGDVNRAAMAQLESAIVDDRWVLEAGLPGLSPDRTDIFPAGVAILSACFDVLQFESLDYVDVSLLQGMISEHLVSDSQADLRQESVLALAHRFAVDVPQAERVTRCVMALYAQSAPWWAGDETYKDLLFWAAQLHELGVHINPRHYHRHGAYIVKHADLPGFTHEQQSMLALLIRGHRRSMPGLAFRAFDPEPAQKLLRLVALLRLAVILERSHNDADSPKVAISVDEDHVQVSCGPGWLEAHPLSLSELRVERAQQATAGITLELTDAPITTASG